MDEQMTYRAIHLGGDNWAVRRFGNACHEVEFVLHVADPQLRESDRKAIEFAKQKPESDWRRV